ncbi:MAG: hypothetical protein GX639_03260 [Fibrobacter sp.]|nr:hypothetical protein [Fibrobacter sp.]
MDLHLSTDYITKLYAGKTSGFSICYFKNKQHAVDAPPHFHIVISLGNGESMVLCMITSQMAKLERLYSNMPGALDSLVPLDPSKLPFITRTCVINCNLPTPISYKEFANIIDQTVGITCKATDVSIDNQLKSDILSAIYRSPIVSKRTKDLLRSIYPDY